MTDHKLVPVEPTEEMLLPCPFCGGSAERVDIEDGDNAGGSCVACTKCQASSNVEFEFKENFISNWNSRVPTPPQSSRDAGLEEAAKIVEGEIYEERYRTWAHWPEHRDGGRGNWSRESFIVTHCDELAAQIRALKSTPSPTASDAITAAWANDLLLRTEEALKRSSPTAPTNTFDNMEGSNEYQRTHDALMKDIRSTAPTVICTNCNGQHEPGECPRNNPTAPTITEEG